MTNSNPRVKRQFQPRIDSYFTQTATANRNDRSLSPPVPHNVQSSLLAVGMRVRKAVPEGYKTHKTITDFVDFAPVTSSLKPDSSAPAIQHKSSQPLTPAQRAELLPFCGIMKTGNLAVQDTYGATDAYARAPGQDGTPFPSQNSTFSVVSSDSVPASHPSNMRKRGLLAYEEDEDDEDMGAGYADGMVDGSRQFAVPRSGRRRSRGVGGTGPDDFEEADFLEPVEWDDVEMEMGL